MRYLLAAVVGRNCTRKAECGNAWVPPITLLPSGYPTDRWHFGVYDETTEKGRFRLGYVIHPGVSPEPPYSNEVHINSSLELMLKAYNVFNHRFPGAWAVFSSYAWDLCRLFTYFPNMPEGQWWLQYKRNFSRAATILSHATARKLELVADYGCRRSPTFNPPAKWTSAMNLSFCSGELHMGVSREARAAQIVNSIGQQANLTTINFEKLIRGRITNSLLNQGYYLHPTKATSIYLWNVWLNTQRTTA